MIEPDDTTLPFLAVWGAWVWKGAVLAAALAAFALSWRARRSVRRAAATAGVAGLAAAALLAIVGEVAAARMRGVDGHDGPARVGELDALSIAAATPLRRREALDHLYAPLEQVGDDRSARALLAAAELARGCDGLLWVAQEWLLLDELTAWARRCGRPDLEVWALSRLGHFERAADVARAREVGADARLVAAIAAGRWDDAAAAADAVAAPARAAPVQDAEPRARTETLACLADLFRHHGGDAAALARIEARAADGGPCAVVLAGAMPLAEWRIRWGDASPAWLGASPGGRAVHDLLRWAGGAELEEAHVRLAEVVELGGDAAWGGRPEPAWLAEAALAAREGADAITDGAIVALGWRIRRDLIAGDVATARSRAAELVERVRATGAEHHARAAAVLHGVVVLRTSEPPPARVVLHPGDGLAIEALLLRQRDAAPWSSELDVACAHRARAALLATSRGDGDVAPLVAALRACAAELHPAHVLAVLPHVATDREVLAGSLRWWSRSTAGAASRPFAWVTAAAARRDVLRLAGDDAGADGWAAIVDRHLAMLADPKRMLALLLLETP